jgi:hypothetical protein
VSVLRLEGVFRAWIPNALSLLYTFQSAFQLLDHYFTQLRPIQTGKSDIMPSVET